MSNLP
jgi:Leucine-rich repeat (LRR) protein